MIFIHQVFPTVFRLGNVSMNTAMIAVLAVFAVRQHPGDHSVHTGLLADGVSRALVVAGASVVF